METKRNRWNELETTVSYKARARLTPTLTHVVTYELVTSGAEGRAMSVDADPISLDLVVCRVLVPVMDVTKITSAEVSVHQVMFLFLVT
jgi:hypothetical protein